MAARAPPSSVQFRSLLAGIVLVTACAAPASRDARSDRLDALFAELASARNEGEARRIERMIQDLWRRSGDLSIDMPLEQAIAEARDYDYETALAILDELVANHPGHAEAWNQRATVRFLKGELEKSLGDIERTLALEPRHFGALAGRALILFRMGDRAGAAESLRTAVALDPFLRERDLLGN